MRQTCRASSFGALATMLLAATGVVAGTAGAEALPPMAQPGQCFGRVQFPDRVDIERARVRIRAAGRHRRLSNAVVRTISSRVLVAPAQAFHVQIPARYRSQTRIVTTPGAVRSVRIPARHALTLTRVQVAPSRLVWRRRTGVPQFAELLPGQTALTPTGEVLCRVRVPARYATVSHRVLVSAARSIDVAGSAVRRRVIEHVLVAPAQTVERLRPAVYRTVRRTIVLRPAREAWVSTPAVWRDAAREHRLARSGWAQVVCPSGLAPWAMQRLQAGLTSQSYDAGPSDGRARPQTYEALRRFQTDHGMAAGQITVESARALGVVP